MARTSQDQLQLALDLLSLTDPPAKVVGSYALSQHFYPSDIDAFHNVGSPNQVWSTADIATAFATVIKQLINYGQAGNSIVLLDFKTGYHPDWIHLIKDGKIPNVTKTLESPPASFPPELRQSLLSSKRKEAEEGIRQYYTLRWSAEEILNGYKAIDGPAGLPRRYPLAEALAQGTTTKIDTAIWLDREDRWVSLEVWYNLVGYTKLPDYLESLYADVKKYAGYPDKALKVLKRIWLITQATGKSRASQLIQPLFQGKAAVLNQVANDCELLLNLYDHQTDLTKVDKARFGLTIQSFRRRLNGAVGPATAAKILAPQPNTTVLLHQIQDRCFELSATEAGHYYSGVKAELKTILNQPS